MFIHVLIRHAKGAFLPRLRDNTCKDALIIIDVSTYNVFQKFSYPRVNMYHEVKFYSFWKFDSFDVESLLFNKGPFKYFVIMFLTILGPPTHFFDDLKYCKSSKIAIF